MKDMKRVFGYLMKKQKREAKRDEEEEKTIVRSRIYQGVINIRAWRFGPLKDNGLGILLTVGDNGLLLKLFLDQKKNCFWKIFPFSTLS